jgi:hypothetical protein
MKVVFKIVLGKVHRVIFLGGTIVGFRAAVALITHAATSTKNRTAIIAGYGTRHTKKKPAVLTVSASFVQTNNMHAHLAHAVVMGNNPVTVLVATPRNKAILSGLSRTGAWYSFRLRRKGATENEVNTSTSHSSNSKLADVNPDAGGGLGTTRWQEANKSTPNSPRVPSAALSELSLLDSVDRRNIKVGKFTFIPVSAPLNLEMISAPLPRVAASLLVGAVATTFAATTAAFSTFSAATTSFATASSPRPFSSRRT